MLAFGGAAKEGHALPDKEDAIVQPQRHFGFRCAATHGKLAREECYAGQSVFRALKGRNATASAW